MDFPFIGQTFLQLLGGIPLTLKLTAVAFVIASILAVLIAIIRTRQIPVLDQIVGFYVFVLRGTPLLVQIFLIYYGLGQFRPTLQSLGLWQFLRDPYWCSILALALNSSAYASEVLRGGLRSVPVREVETARAYGMSGLLLYRRIILPIAIRRALPGYGNELILMVKATSLTSTVTLMEVTGIAAKLIASSYRPVEVFIAAGVIYLVINFILTRIVALIDWWLTPHLRRPKTVAAKLEPAHV